MKKIDEYKLVIWDLDGTLYFQKEFRKKMIKVLLQKLVLKPSKWKEAIVIFKYRKLREKWEATDTGDDMEMRQYSMTGQACGMPAEEVKRIIAYWMLQEPLSHLYSYRDEKAVELINKLQKQGIVNIVYSDYPTKDKLKALDIQVEDSFAASDKVIGCMKPNPKGIDYIVQRYKIDKKDTIMVGDRMEKDGEAAKAAGVDYLILSRNRKDRKNQYGAGIGLK